MPGMVTAPWGMDSVCAVSCPAYFRERAGNAVSSDMRNPWPADGWSRNWGENQGWKRSDLEKLLSSEKGHRGAGVLPCQLG